MILFRQWCSACHRRQDEGTATIGPNLATVQAWTEEQILVNILDPSREVASEFVEHLAELKDGKTVSGTLLSESDSGLLIRQSDGTKVGLLRSQLKRLVTRGVSLMPEGFEIGIASRANGRPDCLSQKPTSLKILLGRKRSLRLQKWCGFQYFGLYWYQSFQILVFKIMKG
ncbi:MAG: hypothetical protein R3F31_20010 [Verrucomicrobiales bacterium]